MAGGQGPAPTGVRVGRVRAACAARRWTSRRGGGRPNRSTWSGRPEHL